ncbi:MAG: trypsin-like peptidase domain-containing protein [Methanoregulaceae archaeon]|nr:trypsin-like peptidase domain-containing protein [Methanoregulaceae archaeon]
MRILVVCLALATSTSAVAQSSGVAIELQSVEAANRALMPAINEARQAKKLPTPETIKQWLAAPLKVTLDLPKPNTTPLKPAEILARSRKAMVRLGWHYLCKNCDNWHTSLAAAYAIAPGYVATCDHVIQVPETMREGVFVCATADGKLIPILGVVGHHAKLDAAILKVDAPELVPLPLQPDAAPGDAAFLYSDPVNVRGYFSTGIINRFFWQGDRPGYVGTLDGIASLRINLSTDWAPGSSGAPLIDAFGNALGHVTTISPVSQGEHPMFWTHEAVPARGILKLLGK